MLDLWFIALLTVWSSGLGLFVLARFGHRPDHPLDALALALPVGLGLLGLGVFGLAEIGELKSGRLSSLLVGGAVFGAPALCAAVAGWSSNSEQRRPTWERVDSAFALTLFATLVGTLLTALAPVTDGDALCYHLQVPRRFLERGAAFYDPDLHETVYPLLTEMVYVVALAFRGPVACRLVEWLLGLTFALNVTSLARTSLGERAWWAGTIALLVPAVSNGMSAPLNDVSLAAFGTAALVAWSRFHDRPTLRAAALTGLLTGLAMGVKYPALVLAGLIGLAVSPGILSRLSLRVATGGFPLAATWRGRRTASRLVESLMTLPAGESTEPRRRKRTWHLLAYVTLAWLTGGCWYARAWINTGNPVHPFYRQTFAGAGLDEVLGPEKRPLSVDPWHLLTALGPLSLEPEKFDSFSHQFGPVFLLFLPALLWERPPRRVLQLAAIGYGFLMICLTQRQSMRFLLIAIGPLSVAVAWLTATWWNRQSRPGRALVLLLLLALGFESTLALARSRHGLGVVFGRETAEQYLSRREPTFRVGRWVGENLPATAWIVGQDHRGYYFPCAYGMELAHRRRTGLGKQGESAFEVVEKLRDFGFTHVLLCPPVPESAVEFDPTLGRLLDPWLATHHPVYREDLTDGDGILRQYAIYPLTDDRLSSRTERGERHGH
ncbi:MAG: hypothetical protein NVSMB9_08910 [Isosphaeraceae bacterium]